MAGARQAERTNAVLRRNMEKTVGKLEKKVHEIKHQMSVARSQRISAANEKRIALAREVIPRWHEVPLGPLPAIALPPGATAARRGRRGKRGRSFRIHQTRSQSHDSVRGGVDLDRDEETPVLPPGDPFREPRVKYSGLATVPSKMLGLPVLNVGDEGRTMTIAAEDSAALPPGPDMVIVTLSDGGEQVLAYAKNSRVSASAVQRLLLVAAGGVKFPMNAAYVRPALQARFLVKWISDEELHVDGWTTPVQGSGFVRAQLASGEVLTLPFARCSLIGGGGGWTTPPQHMMALHASKGCVFPRQVAYISPMAGSPWASPYHQGTISASGASYYGGLAAEVSSVSVDGKRMHIQGKRLAEILEPAGRVVIRERDTCAMLSAYFSSSSLEGMGGATMLTGTAKAELVAAPGTVFPKSAKNIILPHDPVVSFSVYWRSKDGGHVRVQAPDNGSLHKNGGVVVATGVNGEQAVYRVRSAQRHIADADGPEGILLVAAPGIKFPADVVQISQSGPVLAEGVAPLSVEYVDAQGGYTYRVGKDLSVGDKVYVDRDFVYTALPASLRGHTYIESAMGDAGADTRHNFVTLMVNRPADIYVLYDARAREPPQWLSSACYPLGGAVETNRGPMAIWKTKLMVTGSISLGGNAAFPAEGEDVMYTIVVLPAASHRARPPSSRVAAAAMSSMQYPVMRVSPRGDSLTIMARPTSAFPVASDESPQILQVQKRDGAIVEAVYVGMEVVKSENVDSPPQITFRASSFMSFPAEASGASPAAEYQIVFQSPDGNVMRINCPNDGRFSPGPGRVKVKMAYGRQADFPYASLRATAGGMEVRAPEGLAFPADAVSAAPAAVPLADPVVLVSPDSSSMRLLVADTAVYFPGASVLRVVSQGGFRVERIRYSAVQYVTADVNGPAGLEFQAKEGEEFPKDALCAEPLAFPVLSVKPNGLQMEVLVPSAASFPAGPCQVKLKSVDGDDVSIPYITAALLASKADGQVRMLLVAQSTKPFPRMPSFAEPNCAARPYTVFRSRQILFPILNYMKATVPGVTASSVSIQAGVRDGFLLTGGYIKVYCSGGEVLQVPYTRALEQVVLGGHLLKLTLPRGATLPGDAVQMAPESAPVISTSLDFTIMQIAAINDGSFLPGPGVIHARLRNGKEKRLDYEMLAFLPPGSAAGGMIMTAAKGKMFPAGIVAVRPCPYETASLLLPSRVVGVGSRGRTLTIHPSSSFPARGIVDVSLPDGSRVHVDYVSSHLSPSAFAVTLADGTSVNVPPSFVERIAPHAKVSLADGTQHTVALSAVQPKKRNPATAHVIVTLPDGKKIKVPETSIATDKNRNTMVRVMLQDNQRVEVPAEDVLPVHRTYLVKIADNPAIEVPEARVCPCSCTETLQDCSCSCSGMHSAHEDGRADKFQVELPDGNKLRVLPDDISIGNAGPGTKLRVSLPGGGHATVEASKVNRHVKGLPDGMVEVALAGGAVQVVSEASLRAAASEPGQYQVLLPKGLYSLVGANAVSQARGKVTVKLADGDHVNIPESNVHWPAPELRVALGGGRTLDVLPNDVTFTEAHLQVLLPNGKTVKMAASRVSEIKPADGAPAELVLEAVDGAAFPHDAQYVSPVHMVPLEVTQTSQDGRRLVVIAPPDSLPDGYSRVRIIQATGRSSEVNYESAHVLPGHAVGPFMAVNKVAADGSWMDVVAPAALPHGPGMLRAALKDGKQVDVMYSEMEQDNVAGMLRLLSRPGFRFPLDILQVAAEGPRKVILTARRGDEFPPKAVGLVPLREVQTSFPVVTAEEVRMRVDARDDGTFPQGPGVLRVRVQGGMQMLVAYDSVAVCMPDLIGPGGLVFTAPAGVSFPVAAEMVQATAGFGHSDGSGGANEELISQAVSGAESQEALGPPCTVTMQSPDGSKLQVAPYGLFSDSGGLIDVKIANGPVVRVKYDGVKRQEAHGYVTVQTLVAARGSRFPDRAVWVQPVGQQKLEVGTMVAGSELYSDDPAHQFTSVPDELRGSKLIMTDNAARGSKQENQLAFTLWGWSTVYVLRPDAKCDMSKVPVTCSYLTADVPMWFSKHLKPRPDLFVSTTDGSMAVYESLHPLQGPVTLGGNADVPSERLVLSAVVAKSVRIYEVANATSSTSLYVDRIVTIRDLPEELQNEPMIQTASVDKDSADPHFLSVVVSIASDCYVLRDNSQGQLPMWLSESFEEIPGLKIQTSEGPRSIMQSRLPLYGHAYFGGNGGGESMYSIICVATKYSENTVLPEPRVGISQIQVVPDLSQGELGSEIAALEEQQPIEQLYVGQELYVDNQEIRILKVPAQLQGATLVRTARMDKDRREGDVMSFYVSQPADIYIVRDDMPSHSWMPVAAVAYPGDASASPSTVLFVSADGTKMRVNAQTPFPAGPAAVLVRNPQGREVEVEYSEAADAESAWMDSAVLLPGGLEIVAKRGSVFPADSASVIPAAAVGISVTEMAVVGGSSIFPRGPGLAIVRTRDGREVTVRFASSHVQDVPSGGSQRIILKAPKGEQFPVNAELVRPVEAARDALPQWLAAGFILTEMTLDTSRGKMHVYKSRLPVDDRVVLGGNAALPAQGSLWGNYAVIVLPAGSDPSRGAGSFLGAGAFPLDNYVVAIRPVGAPDMSPGAPGTLAVGAASAFISNAHSEETHVESVSEYGQMVPVITMPAQYSVVGIQHQGSRLLVQVQGVDGSFMPASAKAPQRLDVMQATGSVAEYAYVNVQVHRASQDKEAEGQPPVLAFDAPKGFRFPPNAVAVSPSARFLVVAINGAQTRMIVASSGLGMLGVAAVKIRTKQGVQLDVPVTSTYMEGGLLVIKARAPDTFPDDSALVGPAATPPPVAAWTSSQRRFPVFKTSTDRTQLVVQANSESDFVAGPETVVLEQQDGKKVTVKYETAAMLPRLASGVILVQMTAPPGSKFPEFAQYCEPQRSAARVKEVAPDAEEAEYMVLSVDRATLIVHAPADTFPPGPARVRVTVPRQGPMLVPYSSVRRYRGGEGPSELIFVAASGYAFPSGSFSVTPEFEPIISIRHDGLQMQVKAPDDGTWRPGPAKVSLKLGDGSIMTTQYSSAARLFSGSPAGGVLLTAQMNTPFPLDAVSAAPESPRQFNVCEAAADGTEIRVTAKNDGSFEPAPSSMSLVLSGLGGVVRHQVVMYESLSSVPASGECPAGLVLRGDFGREVMSTVIVVTPMNRHDNEYGSVLQDVECRGLAVCKTGLLNIDSALHADDLGAQMRRLPSSLQGLEYIRTPASPKGLHGPGVVSINLAHAADVFILVPEIQNLDASLESAPWFAVLRISKDFTKLVVVVPKNVDVPGPAFPASPWVLKIKTSDGATSTNRYVSVRRLENDGTGKAAAVDGQNRQDETSALHNLKDGMLVELSSGWGENFPAGAFSVTPVSDFEPPEWISLQFSLTSLTVETTKGAMLVWKSKRPRSGHISLEGLLDAPALHPATVSNVKSKGVVTYKVASLAPGSRLYVDGEPTVTEVPAALSGMALIQTAVADAQNTQDQFLRFTVDEPSHVYVLASGWSGAEPSWLSSGFECTEMSCETSIGRLAVWRSLVAVGGDVNLGGNFGAAAMYAVVVVPEARSQLPMAENYVVAVRSEPSFDPIGVQSAFADAPAMADANKMTAYPQAKDLAVYPVSYVNATSIVVQCDADAPFPPAPGRMQLVLQDGQTVEVAYTEKEFAQRQTYVVETGQPNSRSELVVLPPSGMGGRKLPQGSGTVAVQLADGRYVNVPYAEFQEIPTLDPSHKQQVLVVAAPGHTFPPGTLSVSPTEEGLRFTGPIGQRFPAEAALATPSPQFQVNGISLDGTKMRIAVPDDGTFAQGPSELSVRRSDGSQLSLPYSHMFQVAATDIEPSGIVFVSRPGESFPGDCMLAGPAAGPALRITDIKLQVASGASTQSVPAYDYRIGTVGYGKRVYADGKDTFVDVPDALLGSVYIQTTLADSTRTSQKFLTFNVNEPAFIVILVESPKKKDSWVPYWFPEFLGGAGGTELLPLWMTKDFKHSGLEVLSTHTRYEVFMSKKRYTGQVVLGGNEAAPSAGSRKMYDVLVCRRNITASGDRRLLHSTFYIPGTSGASGTASAEWTGVSTDITTHSWFPVSAVNGDTLTVQAMSGSFKTMGGEVHISSADGSDAVLHYSEARYVRSSELKSWIAYELKMVPGAPASAAYVRPTETLPVSVWSVRSVSAGGGHIILDGPASAFPQPPAILSLIVPGHKGRIHVAYGKVNSVAGGTATQVLAADGASFPAAASFAGVADPHADGAPQITNIQVTPQGAMKPDMPESPDARSSALQYDVSTVGVGKRLWVDESFVMSRVPASLAGEQFIMTADQDKDLNQPGRSVHSAGKSFCALSFYVSRPGLVLVASTANYVKVCSPIGGCALQHQMPTWLSRDYLAWIDPHTGKQGLVEADDGTKLLLFSISPQRAPDPTPGEVCLGGLNGVPSTSPKHNYFVIVASLVRGALNGPLAWDGTPLSISLGHSPGKWFSITSRSDDGDTIRVAAKGLQDGFSAPLDPAVQSPGPEDGAGLDAMDIVLKDSDDQDDLGLIMIKACDSVEAPYTILRMKPMSADGNEGAGIELTVGPGLSFPPCASYARPYFDSVDGPPGAAFVPPKPFTERHGQVEFARTTWHVPAGAWTAKVTAVRQGGSMGPVSVRYTTSDGTAKKAVDYKQSSGWLVWKDGEDGPKEFLVPLAAHAPSPQGSGEWVRFFTVMLYNPTGGLSLGHPSIVSVQIDSHGPIDAPRIPPSDSDPLVPPFDDEFRAETTSAEAWRYPVIQVSSAGTFMKIVGSMHSPFTSRGAMKLECADGRKEMLNYKSVAPASSVEMQIVDVSEEGYVMVVIANKASIPHGPGLLNLRDKGGNLAEVVYTSAVQSVGSHVVMRAPTGFPFPVGAKWAWLDSTLLLEALDYQPFPTFVTQAPVTDCSVTPAPLAATSNGGFPLTFVSLDGTIVRMEAPSDSPFPPTGRLDYLKKDGSRQVLTYGAVEVLPTATYQVKSQSSTGDRIVVDIIPQDGSEPGTHFPAFPEGPGELIASVGYKRVLISYAHATPYPGSKSSALVFAHHAAPFPGKMHKVSLTTTGLLFSHVVGLEGPQMPAVVGIGGPVSMNSYPVSAQLGLPVDYNTKIDETDPDDQRVKWFPVVDMAADGSHVRVQAPAKAVGSGRGILRLQDSNGQVHDVGYSSATVEPALPFRVYAIAGNASQCLVRAHPYAFPPGPGTLLVTRAGKETIRIQYESATPLSIGSGLLRVTCKASHVFPADTISLTSTIGLVRLQARVGDSFPPSIENVASQAVAVGLARFLYTGAESDGFYIVGISGQGSVVHLSATTDAPFPPSGVVSIQNSKGIVSRFPYDRVTKAPEIQFVIEEVATSNGGGRYFNVKTNGYALPPHGVLLALAPGEDSRPVAYEAVRPADKKPSREGWAEVTLVRGVSLPRDTVKVAMLPRGLLLEAPHHLSLDGNSEGMFSPALASGSVAISKAWPPGFGPDRFPVTALGEGDSTLRVEAQAAQHAWSKGDQWGVMLSKPDGTQEVWPYEIAIPVEEASFPVTWVASDGSTAIVKVADIAVPAAPCIYEVSTRMNFVKRVHVLAAQYTDTGVVSMRAVPGHLFPVDAVAASPAGALEFISYPGLPFPSGLVRPETIAESWAEPTPAHLTKFSVVAVGGGGLSITVAVPAFVHAFMGQAAGRVDIDVGTENGGSLVQQFSYAGSATISMCSFKVAWVKDDGGALALFPSNKLAFPQGFGTINVFDPTGKSTPVRVTQAALGRENSASIDVRLIHVTAAPGDVFPRRAKDVEFDCVTLTSIPQHRFPSVAVDGPVSLSWASPSPSDSDRPIRQRRSQEEAERSGHEWNRPNGNRNEADDAAGGAGPGGAFPFQYTIVSVAPDGKYADVFVPDGLPVPEFVRTFELTCDIRDQQPRLLRTDSGQHLSAESERASVQSTAEDGAEMVLLLRVGTAFPAGPGLLQLTLPGGSTVIAPYESVVPRELVAESVDSESTRVTDNQVLVLAPFGIPFPSSPQTALPLGETLRLFTAVVSEKSDASSWIGCMARPIQSSRFHKEPKSIFAPPVAISTGDNESAEHVTVQVQTVDKLRTHCPRGDPFLKPHPTVSALECASSLQYNVGTLGQGKRAYVDDEAKWGHLPTMLLGRPVIMTAVQDNKWKGVFISLFVDEPSDVFVFLPAAKKTRKARSAESTQQLSWLPFKLPSLLGGNKKMKETPQEKDDIPSWMENEYHVVPDLLVSLNDGEKFDIWRKNVPVLGFLALGGNEGKTKGATRGMYVAVLVPAAGSAANITIEEHLPIGFPGNVGTNGEEGLDNRGSEKEGGVGSRLDWRGDGTHQKRVHNPYSLARSNFRESREASRGTRGRVLARHGEHAESGRRTPRGREAIIKALKALRQRLAQSRTQTGSLHTKPVVTDKGHFGHSGYKELAGHERKGVSTTDLVDMVKRCGSTDEAGRCLVLAQTCMSARTLADPANCKCFVDAVESFSSNAPAASPVCHASCMSAVQEAYDSHVQLVTGKFSPCL